MDWLNLETTVESDSTRSFGSRASSLFWILEFVSEVLWELLWAPVMMILVGLFSYGPDWWVSSAIGLIGIWYVMHGYSGP